MSLTSEMALCVAFDPRQEFGRYEPDIMKQAEKGLQERLKRLYDLNVHRVLLLYLLRECHYS